YLQRRDESAFEALVTRHAPMVLGVCRRMLGDALDVEDAFQATFLVLVRRSRQLGPRDAIGPWLHGVAVRVALRARSRAARRRRHEPITLEFPAIAPVDPRPDPELGEILDQELSRLPAKYRSPLVLCYLEGRTHEEAAQQLQWPLGTLKGRLARARILMRSRLARRGLSPTAGAVAILLIPDATAALQHPLVERTVRSSWKLASGQALSQVVSASITSLVQGVLVTMVFDQLKWVGLAVLVGGLAWTGAAALARQDQQPQVKETPAVARDLADPAGAKEPSKAATASPASPALRMEAEKPPPPADPRGELVQAARAAYRTAAQQQRQGIQVSLTQVYDASRRWMNAELEGASTPAAKVAAVAAHLDRVRDLLRFAGGEGRPHLIAADVAQAKAYVAEAQLWLAQARSSPAETGSEAGDGPGKDPRSRRILAKLDEPIAMNFPAETPLDEVLKHIRDSTKSSEMPKGLPIYVDPIGLQEAERSLNSTVSIDLEGVPLRRTLQLVLAQLGLIYHIEDGMLYITSDDSEQLPLPPSIRRPSPILERVAKAERGELSLEEMKQLIEELKIRDIVRRLGSGEPEETKAERSGDEASRDRQQMNLLLKEVRELIGLLKAERQAQKTPVAR
ncbi:MAG TPA: sigma-70 family RNA polymerase sigma factor, partial [Isosphaeraceae bacterium]|nr:sigma-70 family RNA polymerase sigma factor [Isosphaeraceae bacterium]